jgi:hypothetical protein
MCASAVFPQSTDQNFPTPVTDTFIESTINARDIGDSRLTNYFYTFDGDQGDLFINIVTNNLTGSIDLFTLDGLRPMTKISVYGDLSESETGRVVYLRKREKLLLRVQGRTPNDEQATFRIKFAGSFIAANSSETNAQPELPTVKKDNTGIAVNSVGTVIERKLPKPPATSVAETKMPEAETQAEAIAKGVPIAEKKQVVENDKPENIKPEVVITDKVETKPRDSSEPAKTAKNTRRKRVATEKPKNNDVEKRVEEAVKVQPEESEQTAVPEKTAEKNLASIRLIVLFKDGTKIERPMDEVLRFTVDDGVLTIISKDGRIGRYSIFDIVKTTIE